MPARTKGIRLGFCQTPQTREMVKGEDHDGEGFASTCTRRCRRSTSRSTGSDPCPPTLLDQLPCGKIPPNFQRDPQTNYRIGEQPEESHDSQRRIREIEGFGGGEATRVPWSGCGFRRGAPTRVAARGACRRTGRDGVVWGAGNGWGVYI